MNVLRLGDRVTVALSRRTRVEGTVAALDHRGAFVRVAVQGARHVTYQERTYRQVARVPA